jgi:hypothetical protein
MAPLLPTVSRFTPGDAEKAGSRPEAAAGTQETTARSEKEDLPERTVGFT